MRKAIAALTVGLTVALVACAPKRVHEEPILRPGDRVADPDDVAAGTASGQEGTGAASSGGDAVAARALADCEPGICDAVVRGEVLPGMTLDQVLAASRTTESAWTIRSSGGSRVMVARSLTTPPRDAVGEIAMVQLRDGRALRLSYHEAEGIRLVRSPEDQTPEGRARARAGALVEEGDELAAAGRFGDALNRYDRAAVLDPEAPMVDYRIATILDRQFRPLEALLRYRLFLHEMELERIEAKGEAAAKIAEAIARARERVIVLERRVR